MKNISKDELFRILSSGRRRYIIYFLHREGEEMSLGDLATRIAAEENERTIEDVTDAERQRVYISLYQTHLPKLQEADIVEYDDEERLVTLTDEMQRSGFFWMTEDDSPPWHRYYAILGAFGWLLILGIWSGLLAAVPWAAVSVVLTLGLTVLVVAQFAVERGGTTGDDAFESLVE